jgi:hypothetical protein
MTNGAQFKDYLGDSVYVDVEHDYLKLTTDNGMGPSDTIYLEPAVYQALLRYVARVEEILGRPYFSERR